MLSRRWRVLEPFQRGSSDEPLTVATHVRDLHAVIQAHCDGRQPILVGHSWGAMLALTYAAETATEVTALVLIGCGTFSDEARAAFEARYAARLTSAHHTELARIERSEPDADRRLAALGRLSTQLYGYDLEDEGPELRVVDAVAHRHTWSDMLRLQRNGTYPASFAAIRCPVLMLHGDADPHPGPLTYEDLREHIPHLEYRELQRCGHSPCLERQARKDFVEHLETWLVNQWRSGEAG